MYTFGVMGTLCLESSVVVNLAMYWVMIVPKTWCHVVKKRAVIDCTLAGTERPQMKRSRAVEGQLLTEFWKETSNVSMGSRRGQGGKLEGAAPYQIWQWSRSTC